MAFDLLHWKAFRAAEVGRGPASPMLIDGWTVVFPELNHVGMEP